MKKNTSNQSLQVQTQEEIRRLRTLLLKEDHQVYLFVTSSIQPSFYQWIEACAHSFALVQKNMVIVNLNLSQANPFETLREKKGVEFFLSGEADFKEVCHPLQPKLDVLSNQTINEHSSDVLESNKLTELIQILRKQYDYVFIMAASLSENYDSLIVGEHVDALIYVKQQIDVSLAQVTQHATLLRRLDKPVAGIIMTQMQRF